MFIFGSNLFKVTNSSSGESQVKLTSAWSIGINTLYNSKTGSKVKSGTWNHIFLRVCTMPGVYQLIAYIKMTNEGFNNLFSSLRVGGAYAIPSVSASASGHG